MRRRSLATAAGVLLLAFSLACGGGGGSSSGSGSGGNSAPALTIATDSFLHGTLTGQPYSVTLTAQNGVGALTWSISPIAPTALYVTGLSIDPATGVLTGTANFGGTAGFTAKVVDSASPPHIATKGFTITANTPLQAGGPQSATVGQYQFGAIEPSFSGGVYPYSFSLSGTLAPGLLLNGANGEITGTAFTAGVFVSTLTIQDSFSPPEVVTQPVTITVVSPSLNFANSLPNRLLQNHPFSGRVVATGGLPPYHFSVVSGSMPPGISSLDPNSGQTSGTPTTLGTYSVTVSVSDSANPPQSVTGSFNITVAQAIGRNDTIATATPVGNEGATASISPYIDPPGAAPLPADNDYYKLVSLAGPTSIVHIQTVAAGAGPSLLDTVIEILDGNGTRYTTCRQPGDTTSNFNSSCLNDDIGGPAPSLNSALDFQVPGAANTATTFYVHVLDWRGDARPDMIYFLGVSGVASPMIITSPPLVPAARTHNYSQQMTAANGIGSVTWSKTVGNLPPGITLGTNGSLTGIATANGSYSFTLQATDSATPPQTATVQESIQVVDPVKITSSPNLPDACLNQPYTFTPTKTGGLAPFRWTINGFWIGIFPDLSTGVFSGSSPVTGTYSVLFGVTDATNTGDGQTITLTINQCP